MASRKTIFINNQIRSCFYKFFSIDIDGPIIKYMPELSFDYNYNIYVEQYNEQLKAVVVSPDFLSLDKLYENPLRKNFEFKDGNIEIDFIFQGYAYKVDKTHPCEKDAVNKLYREVFVKCQAWSTWYDEQEAYLRALPVYDIITYLQYTHFGDEIVNKRTPIKDLLARWKSETESIISAAENYFETTVVERPFGTLKTYEVADSPARTVILRRKKEYFARFPLLAQLMRKRGLDVSDSNIRATVNALVYEALNKETTAQKLFNEIDELTEMFSRDLEAVIVRAPKCIEPIYVVRTLKSEFDRVHRPTFKSTSIWQNNFGDYMMYIAIVPGTPLLLTSSTPKFGDEGEILLPPEVKFSPIEFDGLRAKLFHYSIDYTGFYITARA